MFLPTARGLIIFHAFCRARLSSLSELVDMFLKRALHSGVYSGSYSYSVSSMLETASLAASSFIRDLSLVHNNESQPHTNWAAKTKHKGVASSESKHLKPKIATKIFSVELFRIENTIYKINLETKIGCMTRPFSLRCILRPCRSAFVKTYHWSSSGTSKTNLHVFPNDKRKWTKNSPVPVLLIFSDFFNKKFVLGLMYFLQESGRKIISCKKYIKPRANFFCQKFTKNDQGIPNFC